MKYALALLAGLVLGALLVYFLLVGAPSAGKLPGTPVTAPAQGGDPPGTAVITLDEKFFDSVLASIFKDVGAPSFPLELGLSENLGGPPSGPALRRAAFQGDCASQVVLQQQGSNIKTGVRLVDGKITAPLAFTGSYNAFGTCLRFQGWAQANIQLSFDQPKQVVYGRINVEGVNLDNTPAMVGGVVTMLVQRSINQRVNPLEILQSHQLMLAVPVKASNGTLKAQVKDVREEVSNGKLSLHITYDFAGQKGGQ